jgi:sugar lactone lactonase YvrE
MTTVDIPFALRCELGEGPHWDAERQILLFVDINRGAVHQVDPSTGAHTMLPVAPYVSLVVPIDGGERWICAARGDLMSVRPDGQVGGRRVLEAGRPGNRINDGKADPAGRLWCGSMSLAWAPGQSWLYCVDTAGVHVVADRVTLSNGLDWDVDRERMYYIDSTQQCIDVFRYDVATGAIADRRPFVTIDPADGLPDGMTIDAEGCVWVALFGGGAVRRYDPDGTLMAVIDLPVRHPTSIAFGGSELDTMFVTTSRHKLDAEGRARCPESGAVLVVDAGVAGRPANRVSVDVAIAIERLPIGHHSDDDPVAPSS